jgi:hypothetical protein
MIFSCIFIILSFFLTFYFQIFRYLSLFYLNVYPEWLEDNDLVVHFQIGLFHYKWGVPKTFKIQQKEGFWNVLEKSDNLRNFHLKKRYAIVEAVPKNSVKIKIEFLELPKFN